MICTAFPTSRIVGVDGIAVISGVGTVSPVLTEHTGPSCGAHDAAGTFCRVQDFGRQDQSSVTFAVG